MKILATLINLVPYHVARWNAAAGIPGAEIDIVQMRSQDEFSILEASGSDTAFRLTTLGFREERVPPRTLLAAMEKAFDASRPDVAVINGYSFPISLTALMVACERRIPAVICSESNRDDFQRRWHTEAVKRRVVRLCGAGLAGATPQMAYLCELGLPAGRVFSGYNAVDNAHFVRGADLARARAAELRAEYGLPERFYLAVARFTEKKNLAGLIAAYGLFAKQAAPAVPDLVILGDGPLRSALERQIGEAGLAAKVHLPGPVGYDLLPAYYGLATAFVHASSTEQWGLVVNEAMAAGLPVLVSDRCGCAQDLVSDGGNGYRFAPHDGDALAGLFGRLSAMSPDGIARMGAASRELIAKWGPDRFAAGVKSACGKALEAGPKRLTLVDRLVLNTLIKR